MNILTCILKVVHYYLLTDFFEDFRKMSSEIYQLRPAKFLSAPGLAWQTTLKRTRV